MDQTTVTLLCTVISGGCTIAAAVVPPYLQSRKSREVLIHEIHRGDYYHYPFWHLLLGVSLPLVCWFVIGTYILFGMTGGMLILADQMPDAQAVLASIDINKSAVLMRKLVLIEILLEVIPMFVVFLFTAKYISHRFSPHRTFFFVGLAAVLLLSIEIGLSIHFQSAGLPNQDIIRNVAIFAVDYFIATFIGVRWARNTQPRFLLACVFDRLEPSDRQALSELAKSLVPISPNQGIQADEQRDVRG